MSVVISCHQQSFNPSQNLQSGPADHERLKLSVTVTNLLALAPPNSTLDVLSLLLDRVGEQLDILRKPNEQEASASSRKKLSNCCWSGRLAETRECPLLEALADTKRGGRAQRSVQLYPPINKLESEEPRTTR